MKSPVLLRSLALLTLFAAPASSAAVCRVAPDGTGNGASWASPMSLQAALGADACHEIWLRKGLYKPVVPAAAYPTTAERRISFVVRPGVRVYGGFAGTESLRDARDAQAHRAVLSGDIDNDDTTDADGITTDADGVRNANSYHVVAMDGGTAAGAITRGTVLDGVVITAGYANGGTSDLFGSGGGLLCRAANTGQECSPTLRDVLFSGNRAVSGGGVYLSGVAGGISRPLLERVRFSGNRTTSQGGGLCNDGSNAGRVEPELIDVEFTGNRGGSYGGAIMNHGRQGNSSPRLDRVGFSGNSATYGGAIYNDATSSGVTRASIRNATFHGNNASAHGGAIYNYISTNGDGRMLLAHVTFSGNVASKGGAIYNDGSVNNQAGAGETLQGVILWGNVGNTESPQIHNQNAAPSIADSIVEGGCPNGSQCSSLVTGNPALGALAYNGGFSRTMLPNTGSSAINAAASATCTLTDQRAVPRAQGIRCDIGAVEVAMPACHVKHDAGGSNNGTSWANAYTRLQDALANADCGEIRVARGVYTPTTDGNVATSFAIRPGQRVYGGFAGTETTLGQRDPAANRTVLSGDLDHDDLTDADGIVVEGTDRRGNNSKRVVKMDGTTAAGNIGANTVLDGFAITAAAGWDQQGGGLYCNGSGAGHECSPSLRNLLFSANFADMGGGLYNYADDGGRANPTLTNITFRNNSASYVGGGLYNQGWNGGDSSPALTNVTFVGNGRGAMGNDGNYSGRSSPLLNHVTFHANSDGWTAASMLNSGSFGGSSEPVLTNVIIWGGALSAPSECGTDDHVEICNQSATPTIRASLIAGGCPAGAICGADVRDLDPQLAALADNGGVGPTLMPAMDGPAVDAGADDVCVETDQRGVSRPQGPRCDIGAVEAINDRIFANGFD